MQLAVSIKWRMSAMVAMMLSLTCLPMPTVAAERYTFIGQPAEGYQAIRFNRHVRFENLLVRNDYTFEAGTVLIHDRVWTKTGQAVFCGPTSVDDGPLRTWCFAVNGNSFGMPEYGTDTAEAPPGSFTSVRLRFE